MFPIVTISYVIACEIRQLSLFSSPYLCVIKITKVDNFNLLSAYQSKKPNSSSMQMLCRGRRKAIPLPNDDNRSIKNIQSLNNPHNTFTSLATVFFFCQNLLTLPVLAWLVSEK